MVANLITTNPNIQGGTPCFTGTRVPVASLFDHLEQGYSVAEFLADFPTVKHAQAIALLELAKSNLNKPTAPATP